MTYFAGGAGTEKPAGGGFVLAIIGESIGAVGRRIHAQMMESSYLEKKRVVSHIVIKGRGRDPQTLDWVDFENDPLWNMILTPNIIYKMIEVYLEPWAQPVCYVFGLIFCL